MRFLYREELQPLVPYPPGMPIEEVQRQYGLTEVVKLASNENPCGPSPRAVEALKAEAPELHRYPESACYYLRSELAGRLGVPPEHLIFGAGSDEIVALMALAYLRPGDNIVTSDHAFIRYEMGATMMGAATRKVQRKDWRADVDALLAAVDSSTRFVFIANPDNPLGTGISAAEVERLLNGLPASVVLVLDEAYFEYACDTPDYPNSMGLAQRFPNLVVTRTFSKAYGLAGLRIGYAIAQPDFWDPVERVRPPFNVSRAAQAAALAALSDTEHLRKSRETNRQGMAVLQEKLAAMGLDTVPSAGNFLLVEFGAAAPQVFDALLRRGVIVRPVGIYQLPNHLRISIGLPGENQVFVRALEQVWAELAPSQAAR